MSQYRVTTAHIEALRQMGISKAGTEAILTGLVPIPDAETTKIVNDLDSYGEWAPDPVDETLVVEHKPKPKPPKVDVPAGDLPAEGL